MLTYHDYVLILLQQQRNEINELTTYNQEALTALYKSLEFMECNDLPCEEVKAAISEIESNRK